MKTPGIIRLAHITAAGLCGLGFLSSAMAAPLPGRITPALQLPVAPTPLDLRVPHDPFVPGNQAGSVALELRAFPSGMQRPARDAEGSGTNDHATPAGLSASEADFHFASPAEKFVGRMHREGLPIARLWKSESALLSIGLNKRGKPGVWFTKTLR
jgi:hypothetical protein